MDDSGTRVRLGMIHGRFQPFHLGHLEYLHLALARADNLLIGITNPDPWTLAPETVADHRHREDANPLTYYERARIIAAVLTDEGVPHARWEITAFPVNFPERYAWYAPQRTVQFLRVFSEWEQTKADRLSEAGYRVEILQPGRAKQIEATEVRQRLRDGGDWETLVPPATARVLQELRPEWFGDSVPPGRAAH